MKVRLSAQRRLMAAFLFLMSLNVARAGDPVSETGDDSALPHFPLTNPEGSGVRWVPLLKESFLFLGMQHAFRVATESDTREGLGGPFFKGWAQSAGNLHGWADGDPFFVNYVGHPMEGAVAGFLFVQNDPKYRRTEFGRNRDYWRSRLRAAGWAWAYSTQFEIGPLSEATIGKVQSHFPQQGFVDHVITPSFGLGWMIAEDALDKYVVRRVENSTQNKTVRILARGFLNPSRSMANVLGGELPWHRDSRGGVSAVPVSPDDTPAALTIEDRYENERAYAPFELAIQYDYAQIGGTAKGAMSCNGGSGAALFNLTQSIGLEAEIGGCKVLTPDRDVSGDATWYLAGPRYTFRDFGRWSPYVHALGGYEKLTSETLYPDRKAALPPEIDKLDGYKQHAQYTTQSEASGFALQFGGGVDYTINGALALKVANLEYLHTYTPDFNGLNAQHNFRFTTGLVLRMGTW